MGEGIERARKLDPEAARAIENMRDQLLIVFVRRLGGRIRIPVIEVDATEGMGLGFRLDGDFFVFELIDSPKPASPPVDRSQRTMEDGSPENPDHREIDPATGMQKGYVVLSAAERAKGFVRPVRRSYVHDVCGSTTTMATALAETYARDPGFYGATFCAHCMSHFPVEQFRWMDGTSETVGS